MSITIKGNPLKSLCTSCRFSSIAGNDHGDIFVQCRQFSSYDTVRMPQPVMHCTEWEDAAQPSLYDMKKTAYLLDPSKKIIGFVKPGTELHKRLNEKVDD